MVQGINNSNVNKTQATQASNTETNIYKSTSKKVTKSLPESSDEKTVRYTITDGASETNEAQKEVEDAKKNGQNLKDIVQNLETKCKEKNTNMETIKQELAKYEVEMKDYIDANIEIEDATESQLKDCAQKSKAEAQKAEQTKNEIQIKTKKVNDAYSNTNATESDIQDAEENQSEIDALSAKYAKICERMDKYDNYQNKEIKKIANDKAETMGKSIKEIAGMLETNINDAINANEYADVAIEKGLEAVKLKDNWNDAYKAGFGGRGLFAVFSATKDAESSGNNTIARGEQLGNSSKEVAKKANTVRKQYGVSMKSTVGVKDIANKEYVDTSKMENLKEFEQGYGYATIIKNAKIKADNKKIIDDVAEQAKKKAEQK